MQHASAAIAAVAVGAAVFVAAAADAPPRPAMELHDAVLRCHALHSRDGSLTGTVNITVTVGTDGRATAVTTPPGTGDRAAIAAQCVGTTLHYKPALRDGQPVPEPLDLAVTFPSLPTVRGELRRVVDYCHAPWTEAELKLAEAGRGTTKNSPVELGAMEGSINLVARVGTDGKVKEYRLPAGVLPWMSQAVKCVADRLEFYPALLRTTLVESWVVVPLHFNLTDELHYDAAVTPPSPRSGDEAILAVYRKCYPAGQTAMVTILYRITVAKSGRVRRAELLESSGNASLDEAGRCILRNLSFHAARRNGQAVQSTLNWPILVRPPG